MKRHVIYFLFLTAALVILPVFCPRVYAGGSAPALDIRKVYYGDGAVKGEFYLNNGKLHGPTKWYHRNGELGALLHYRENVLHGSAKVFYDDGKVKKMAYYQNGKLMTRWVFDESGIMDHCDESVEEV